MNPVSAPPFTLDAADGWQVSGVPAFQDNYLWVVHDASCAVVIDPGDAAPLIAFLRQRGLALTAIVCTHHHADHVGGVAGLLQAFGACPVYGPADEPIPGRTLAAYDGEVLMLAPGRFEVVAVPGHTAGHLTYLWQDRIFCGDTLFALGCGRLFEGTPQQMLHSLQRLAGLPGERWVHCAHEYTLSNLAFALHVDSANPALQARGARERARRAEGLATVPALLSEERATNPFLRADASALHASAEQWAGSSLPDELAVFTALRRWKNEFRA